MKANEAPEKIWIDNLDEGFWFDSPSGNKSIEYIRKDAFIEKADKFISTFFHPDDTELIDAILKKFHEYMKGEEV